jgi:hypothetical protein
MCEQNKEVNRVLEVVEVGVVEEEDECQEKKEMRDS